MRGIGGDGQTDRPPGQCKGTREARSDLGGCGAATVCVSLHPLMSLQCLVLDDGTQLDGAQHPPGVQPLSMHPIMPPPSNERP